MHLGIVKITYNRTATHFMDDCFVNLEEEIILTLLWQSGTSESTTACFVFSLSIYYWLFKCGFVRVCVCVWERERERENERARERERERERERVTSQHMSLILIAGCIAVSEIAHSFTHSLIPIWCMVAKWTILERSERNKWTDSDGDVYTVRETCAVAKTSLSHMYYYITCNLF